MADTIKIRNISPRGARHVPSLHTVVQAGAVVEAPTDLALSLLMQTDAWSPEAQPAPGAKRDDWVAFATECGLNVGDAKRDDIVAIVVAHFAAGPVPDDEDNESTDDEGQADAGSEDKE